MTSTKRIEWLGFSRAKDEDRGAAATVNLQQLAQRRSGWLARSRRAPRVKFCASRGVRRHGPNGARPTRGVQHRGRRRESRGHHSI
eukprot:6627754-Pyramimonas_sp.AAC.1